MAGFASKSWADQCSDDEGMDDLHHEYEFNRMEACTYSVFLSQWKQMADK
jgi:hypothetical protein